MYLGAVELRKKNFLEDQGRANSLSVATSGLVCVTFGGLGTESFSVLCGSVGLMSCVAGGTFESARCVSVLKAKEPSIPTSKAPPAIVAKRFTLARFTFVVGPA